VYQAGTLSGNPLATAAGNAMLGYIQAHPELYERLESLGRVLDDGFETLIRERGLPLRWSRVGAMAGLAFTPTPVVDWETASQADTERFGRFFHGMLEEGIYLAPSAYEALFFSTAHTERDMERCVEAAGRVLERVYSEVSA
jgi:glutamate-1-semialdehyde 2,1-aminomutase